jgi:alpha-beta hydrolase superfamily lysophospholipase
VRSQTGGRGFAGYSYYNERFGTLKAISATRMAADNELIRFESEGVPIIGSLFLPSIPAPVPAMIICHGAGEFKENYFELSEFLVAHGIAALAMDMRGHGQSGGERFHVNIASWIGDIRSAVDFLAKHPAIDKERIGAFGLSSGGTAVLEAALIEPRLKVLVTLAATVRNSVPWPGALVLRLLILIGRLKRFFTRRDLRLSILKLLEKISLVSDPEIRQRLLQDPRATEAFSSFPFPGAAESLFVNTLCRVSGIRIPSLVLWGEEDRVDPPETARMLYAALKCKKRLCIISGNGHAGHLDRNRQQVFVLTTDWALENLA